MSDSLNADVVVIGAGIAGSLAALKMVQAGASVLMLESGPEIKRDKAVELFRNSPFKGDFTEPFPPEPWAPQPKFIPTDNNYLIQKGPDPYRAQYLRGVGGTTWHWAGQAFRLLPNDMRMKTLYGVGRDWPIGYEQLEPYYCEAEYQMGVSGDSELDSPRSRPYPLPGIPLPYGFERLKQRIAGLGYEVGIGPQARNSVPYDGRPACCGNNNCMPVCPIDAQYHGGISANKALAAGARIIANAVVHRIEANEQGQIVAVHYLDRNKVSHRVTGKRFVLTANGIESPKILLISTSERYPNGIANGSGMVGRNLMDHPGSSVEFYADEPVWFGRGPMRPGSINNLRDGAFRAERSALRVDVSNTSPVRYLTERLIRQGYYGKALNDKLAFQSERYVQLKCLLEMLPEPENRVQLSQTEKDAWGIPRLEVYYKFPEYVHRGYDQSMLDFQRIVKQMGGSEAIYSKRGLYDNNQHITGTMIMGSDGSDSVVDGDCRSHDHPNLFIAGTGVMPSASTVNSTLTGVALALHMADRVLDSLKGGMA
ncbi:GMC family oxidoreductase [Serratia quinivorans]|uniref:GMC family oxidoreductase n=1 Tax=Serratia quinivorans TaxID=137545 RepID=UPI002179F8CB|nr:GMC family oxidoreductase [Serratia quinivorans]CAI0804308.1 Gluconate 2-dehydrogenase flavoprotein precursor [Serratia quinivorans]